MRESWGIALVVVKRMTAVMPAEWLISRTSLKKSGPPGRSVVRICGANSSARSLSPPWRGPRCLLTLFKAWKHAEISGWALPSERRSGQSRHQSDHTRAMLLRIESERSLCHSTPSDRRV